ncbi:guanine nucleotide binding protein, alpha subunit [Ephemerocybe angulata]|uniref:Guanine nucleotide binding protein, alpha subunit n=1 Tax=Ephemerocybe angulata TaxID=980116 RepID=A0A8H6I778_9AGAR|nr:guanine nucleotide binding protein, alpha subunit [Tulosesus angulatus]
MVSRHKHDSSLDPLSLAIAPPPNETPEERAKRLREEEEAVEVSRRIDAELKLAKVALKKRKDAVQVLVLGQSMSGKSTTIKNFQMQYAQKAWAEERASWKAVVLLNLVRSVNTVIDIITGTMEGVDLLSSDPSSQLTPLNETHRNLSRRLGVLRQIERDLRLLLGSGADETEPEGGDGGPQFTPKVQEFCVQSSSGWKGILSRVRGPSTGKENDVQRVAFQVISSCRDDILRIWNDPGTQSVLKNRQAHLEDTPGFFLNDINRILSPGYEPSDQDIVRARLRTTGVQEYQFTLDRGNHAPVDWIIYDVAGVRTSRAAWIPYFKEITALIFIAPLSSFDEKLAEDPRINRLEDTFSLWKTVCSNKLLAKVQIILFMNKTDILRKKLESGIKVKHYIQEFRDKENDYETVSNWFKKLFKRLYLANTTPSREFVSHFTSVIDTEATSQTLVAVQGAILRNDFVNTGLL